jgi:hypothetical protein
LLSDEIDGIEVEEEVWKIGSEHNNVSSECETKFFNCEDN